MTDMNAASAMIQALNGLIVDEIAPSLDVSFQDESLAYVGNGRIGKASTS